MIKQEIFSRKFVINNLIRLMNYEGLL